LPSGPAAEQVSVIAAFDAEQIVQGPVAAAVVSAVEHALPPLRGASDPDADRSSVFARADQAQNCFSVDTLARVLA
jgi:hypothetical protein